MNHNRDNGSNDKTEIFFKKLASSYAEKSGNELKKGLANFNGSQQSVNILSLDKKVKGGIRTQRIKKWTTRLMPIAACFIIFMAYIVINVRFPAIDFDNTPNNSAADAPSAILTYEFISEKLPRDYTLEKVDYDRQKAIYYIVGNNDTEVILTVEEFYGNIDTGGLEKVNISDTNAYGISKEDFSFIQYKKDDFLYILTSPNDGYDDLIRLSENLI